MAPVRSRSSSRMASRARTSSISLLTTTPPPGISSCQETPKSWRLILVVASQPRRRRLPLFSSPSQKGVVHSPTYPMSSGTVRVTPRIVSWTSPLKVGAPVRSVKPPLKVSLGGFWTSRECARRRGGAQVRVAYGLAGPDTGGIDLALERRLEAAIPVELQPAVDVLEEAAYPRAHHVAGAELRLGVSRLEHPGRHFRLRSRRSGCRAPARAGCRARGR